MKNAKKKIFFFYIIFINNNVNVDINVIVIKKLK